MTKLAWAACLLSGLMFGCTVSENDGDSGNGNGDSTNTGGGNSTVSIDGSSTVRPVSEAMAEEFENLNEDIKVTVAGNGTGPGLAKFVMGEIDICGASRGIKDSERAECEEKGIDFIQLEVALDGISVVVSPENTWCESLTVEQLKALWEPDSQVTKWNQLNPEWPDEEINLYGPDTESGTFEYFTDAICGEKGASRSDYTPNADDNVLVRGVSGDQYALGYFGFSYYAGSEGAVKAVAIQNTGSDNAVLPTIETIKSGEYAPLARPLYIYVNKASLARPEVKSFVEFFVGEGQQYVSEAGCVSLSDESIAAARAQMVE